MSRKDDSATYMISSDRRALEYIFNRLDYSINGLMTGDYDNAIENLRAAWERLPTDVKDKIPDPKKAIEERLAKLPSELELYQDEKFMQQHPEWKGVERFRANAARNIVYEQVHYYQELIIRRMDEAKLYIRQRGEGVGVFYPYAESTKDMGFDKPS